MHYVSIGLYSVPLVASFPSLSAPRGQHLPPALQTAASGPPSQHCGVEEGEQYYLIAAVLLI